MSRFSGIPKPRSMAQSSRAAAARQQGLHVEGDFAFGTHGGFPTRTPISQISDPSAITAFDQAAVALGEDIDFLSENVQAPFQEATAEFGDFVGGVGENIRATARDTNELLAGRDLELEATESDLVSRLDTGPADLVDEERLDRVATGAQGAFATTDARISRLLEQLGNVGGRIDDAISAAVGAVKTARQTATGFNARVGETISAISAGMQRRALSQKQLIQAGVNPDGTAMTSSEKRAASRQLAFDTGLITAQTTAAVRADATKFRAGLDQALAQTELALADVNLQGAGLEVAATQAGGALVAEGTRAAAARDATLLGVEQQRTAGRAAEAEVDLARDQAIAQTRLAFQELRTNLASLMADITGSAELQATQMELQGRTAYLDMLLNTPFISMFEGLAALLSLATAPGGRNISAFNLPE